jgi:penicillin-binding protein 2
MSLAAFQHPGFHSHLQRIRLFLIVGFLLLVAQLFSTQVLKQNTYLYAAESNRLNEILTPGSRGVILDRDGSVLAYNVAEFSLMADTRLLEADKNVVADVLSTLDTPIAVDELFFQLSSQSQVRVLRIPHVKALELLTSTLPEGLSVETGYNRVYKSDEYQTLSHVIGYVGAQPEGFFERNRDNYRSFDTIGVSGLEAAYEKQLRGESKVESVEVNSRGDILRSFVSRPETDGINLETTLSLRAYNIIESSIQEIIARYGDHAIAAIAMNPGSGEVYALASWPSFDANGFSNGITESAYARLIENEFRPLFHRAVLGTYPSGSTIKTLFAAGALEEGVITPQTSFFSSGGIQVGPWFFPDWRAGGHGATNVYWAIADSVNTFFYIIGGGYQDIEGLGIQKLRDIAVTFGLAAKTGIDLPSEESGLFPSPEFKLETKGERWYIGDTYNTAIGQGDVLVTPLQMARATAVFANGGLLVTPHLRTGLQAEAERIISEETASIIADAMRMTVTSGSGKLLQSVPVPVAGKTGTAQWSSLRENHSWFTGFAPSDEPEVVISILVEEGGDDALALQLSQLILQKWFDENPINRTIAE